MAYCLLGIFDINMSLIYGEGPRAFPAPARGDSETRQRHDDFLMEAWAGTWEFSACDTRNELVGFVASYVL